MRFSLAWVGVLALGAAPAPVITGASPAGLHERCNTVACRADTAYAIFKRAFVETRTPEPAPEPAPEPCNSIKCAADSAYAIFKKAL